MKESTYLCKRCFISLQIEKAQLYSKILVVQKQKELMEAENYFLKQRLCAKEKENAIREGTMASVSLLLSTVNNQS